MSKEIDYLVVGGGIVGVATARAIATDARAKGRRVVLVEKEDTLARHQSGRNSGVLHAGVYYAPDSLKARYCREGNARLAAYAAERRLRFERTGKLIVATEPRELDGLARLEARCRTAGLTVSTLDEAGIRAAEPNVAGIAAIRVAESGIIDYPAVVESLADDARAAGVTVRRGAAVAGLRELDDRVEVRLTSGVTLAAGAVVVCAGVHADRFVRMLGRPPAFVMLPVRGDYLAVTGVPPGFVRHLVYPVPDPDLPYLGVHLTPTVDGGLTLGPNAAPALGREAYRRTDVDPGHLLHLARWPGTWRFLGRRYRSVASEWRSTLFRHVFLARARRYCPRLSPEMLTAYTTGIRAQAMDRAGRLIEDFAFERFGRTLVVCNAPSPAATSCLPIADALAAMVIGSDARGEADVGHPIQSDPR